MKNLKKILALILSLVLVLSFGACAKPVETAEPETSAASTAKNEFVFTVVDLDGNKEEFTVSFQDGQSVGDALIAEKLISGEQGDYGIYVKTVNGITLDYDKDGAYWSFYIGDEVANTGVDGEPATAGAAYSLVATKG